MLYQLPATDYHQITTGSNAGYSAGPGYNMVTGLGTPIADLLVPDLASSGVVSVAMTNTGGFAQGGTGSFTIDISNLGPVASSGQVTVVDTLPAGLTPASADNGTVNGWALSSNGQTITATQSGPLPAGSSYPSLNIAVDITPNAPTIITNSALVSAAGSPSATGIATDSVSISSIASNTTTQIEVPSTCVYGQAVTFTAAVTANGAPVSSGAVEFIVGNTAVASSVPLNIAGQAVFSITTLPASATPYVVTAVYGGASGFESSSGAANLVVSPASLTVTTSNATKTYGDTFTSFAGTIAGLVGGDTITASYTSAGAASTAGVLGGPYPIIATLNDPNGVLANYIVTYVPGELTVEPATLIVAASDLSRPVGQSNPPLVVIYSGFVNGETLASGGISGTPVVTTTATPESPLGDYPISAAIGSLTAQNYTFTFAAGTLTVTDGIVPLNPVLDVPSNTQVVIGSSENVSLSSPVTIDPGGRLSILGGGSIDLPGIVSAGTAAGIEFNGGTIQASDNFTTSLPMLIDSGGATIDSNGYVISLANSLTGPGSLIVTGSGVVLVTGANTYAGGTTVSSGTLIVGNPTSLPSGSALAVGASSESLFGAQDSQSTSNNSAASANATAALVQAEGFVGSASHSSIAPNGRPNHAVTEHHAGNLHSQERVVASLTHAEAAAHDAVIQSLELGGLRHSSAAGRSR
jgi:uncharacterized repeat protein (TIGR01451 family)